MNPETNNIHALIYIYREREVCGGMHPRKILARKEQHGLRNCRLTKICINCCKDVNKQTKAKNSLTLKENFKFPDQSKNS